ncbi:uncharacterized protein DFL_004467 [Arthrobotrys flagrans]|uniref:Uncharacterized protein n=1 Tax=Arthrobotrys flagrans TaxID=97331 RepID=A0A437A543_ARTFL|nr:hypothetical protein DFL_004467 [Arthrobotrys flagrans]
MSELEGSSAVHSDAAPFDTTRVARLHQEIGNEMEKMSALQSFDKENLNETVKLAVSEAVKEAVDRVIMPAVEKAIESAIEKAFKNFKRETYSRESLATIRLHNLEMDDTDQLWFPPDVDNVVALSTHIPNKAAIPGLSSENCNIVLQALRLSLTGNLNIRKERIRDYLCRT